MKDVQKAIQSAILKLKDLAKEYSNKDGWIVESKRHVNVGLTRGLADTAFDVKCALTACDAVVFSTLNDAEKNGVDYYLIDGANKPIQMIFTEAGTFFKRELEMATKQLEFLNRHMKR